MSKILHATKIACLIAFGAFCAMVAAGLLFAVYTNPAHAGAPRVSAPPPNPVTVEMQQARTAKYNAFHNCIGARFHEPAVLADTATFEQLNKDAGWAAASRDLARYTAVVASFDKEYARLNTAYGCAAAR